MIFQSVTNQVIIDYTKHCTVRKYIIEYKMEHVHEALKTGRVGHAAKTKSYVTNESKKDYPPGKRH